MTRTLTVGSPRERAPAPLVGWIQPGLTIRGGVWHTLPTSSFHGDTSRTSANSRDKTVRKVGVVCGKSAIWAAQTDRGEGSE